MTYENAGLEWRILNLWNMFSRLPDYNSELGFKVSVAPNFWQFDMFAIGNDRWRKFVENDWFFRNRLILLSAVVRIVKSFLRCYFKKTKSKTTKSIKNKCA